MSLFEATYGKPPPLLINEVSHSMTSPEATNSNMEKVALCMKKKVDLKCTDVVFEVGDRVLVKL